MRISDWSSDVCSSDLVLKRLDLGAAGREEGVFNAARRHFYRVLLQIGENRELRRLFPSVGMHIIHVQYSAPELQKVRHRDYAEIAGAIMQNDTDGAEEAARRHVDNVRTAIADWHARRRADRKSVVSGKSGAGRVILGGR